MKLINRGGQIIKASLHHRVVLFGEPEDTHLWADRDFIMILACQIFGGGSGNIQVILEFIFIIVDPLRGRGTTCMEYEELNSIGTPKYLHLLESHGVDLVQRNLFELILNRNAMRFEE